MNGSLSTTLLELLSHRSRTSGARRRNKQSYDIRRSQIRRLIAEPLEQRRVLAAYLVTTADDVVAEDGTLSLREAIQAANTNAAVNADTIAGDAGPGITDSITFANGLSAITLGSELTISDSLAISLGDDAVSQVISGNDSSRIFSILDGGSGTAATVTIEGLTLNNGTAESGGAILVSSGQTLSLDSVTIMDNDGFRAHSNRWWWCDLQ